MIYKINYLIVSYFICNSEFTQCIRENHFCKADFTKRAVNNNKIFTHTEL